MADGEGLKLASQPNDFDELTGSHLPIEEQEHSGHLTNQHKRSPSTSRIGGKKGLTGEVEASIRHLRQSGRSAHYLVEDVVIRGRHIGSVYAHPMKITVWSVGGQYLGKFKSARRAGRAMVAAYGEKALRRA